MSLSNVSGYSWCIFGKTNFMPSIFMLGVHFYTCTDAFFLFNKAQPIIHLFCGFAYSRLIFGHFLYLMKSLNYTTVADDVSGHVLQLLKKF